MYAPEVKTLYAHSNFSMWLLTLFDVSKMNPARRERFAYWRAVPLSRLYSVLLAVFFTFGTVGLLDSALSAAKTPVLIGFGSAFVAGVTAISYVLVLARKPALFPVLLICQMLAVVGYSTLSSRAVAHGWLPAAPEHTAMTIFVAAAIAFVMIGYSFFLMFIQTEGRQAIRAQAELTMAHGIQQTLVPPIDLSVTGCQIYGISLPSDKVGGDVVDVVALSDGSAAAYVADIAGHGLQAGILMGMVKAAARTCLLDRPQPDALLAILNQVMPEVKEANMYATCAALHIRPGGDGHGCEVDFSIAGHPPMLHVSDISGAVSQLGDEQFPLGLFPDAKYISRSISCESGDLLLVTTDGVLEVVGKDGAEFGEGKLRELLVRERRSDLPGLAHKILKSANEFGKQVDDQTLLLIRVT